MLALLFLALNELVRDMSLVRRLVLSGECRDIWDLSDGYLAVRPRITSRIRCKKLYHESRRELY